MRNLDYAYLGDGVGIAMTHRNHKILVSTRDFGLSPHIIMHGIWERAIEDAILNLIGDGSTVAEVGCNMGYHTLAMSERIGPNGRLYGFEANPGIFKLMLNSLNLNGFLDRATVFNLAATDREDVFQFQFDDSAVGGGNVVNDVASEGNTVIEVRGVPLDNQLADVASLDLLRMDAEGFEPLVIRGASQLIERSPQIAIVCEWSVAMMQPRLDLNAFIAEMEGKGFKSWRVLGDTSLSPVEMSSLNTIDHCEIVFSRKASPV